MINLSLLRNLIGTPTAWQGQDHILFFEDIDEPLYKIDHMLWQMQQAGRFKGLRGVIVGDFIPHADDQDSSADPTQPPYGKTLVDLLLQYLPAKIPVCRDFPCGHSSYLTTLPIGAHVALHVKDQTTHLALLEAVVQSPV